MRRKAYFSSMADEVVEVASILNDAAAVAHYEPMGRERQHEREDKKRGQHHCCVHGAPRCRPETSPDQQKAAQRDADNGLHSVSIVRPNAVWLDWPIARRET